jgi:hypothetical protein
MKIKIITEETGEVQATLTDENPGTVKALYEALPIEARANIWGDEIYFSIPVHYEEENSKEVVEMGDLGYWPPGNAFCIFFGPTPASRGDEIRPASPVNVFGRVDGDPKVFKKVRGGAKIRLEQV